jgi:serine/threonine-protein kinase
MQLAGYTFGEKIGEGGMARVYRGLQLSLSRPVAIKVLDRQMGKHSQVLQAFERESVIIARLSHPNIIHVIDRGVSDKGLPYFIMEYVDGIDLAVMMREGELPVARKLELALQVCKALGYAHQNGVIHRDIKPSNIIVDSEFNARVLDFGISQFVATGNEVDETQGMVSTHYSEQQNHSATRDVMGTLSYLAPELNSGAAATVASDLYSLALLIFEMLTGRLPTEADKAAGYSLAAVNPNWPHSFSAVLGACLDTDPAGRPLSTSIIADQLLLVLHGAHLSQKQVASAASALDKKTFTLLDVLSENSFGAVYLFADKQTGKQLVVKKYFLQHSGSKAGLGYTSAKRLAALAKEQCAPDVLQRSHLGRVHGASKSSRAFIVVMDYLSGGSLQQRLLRPYTVDEFLVLAQQICTGLHEAHRNNIVHGNLRASNILFDAEGAAKLTDFGLPAHYSNDSEQEGVEPCVRKNNWYSLPSEPLSPCADIYACGVIFYQMLIGELPRIQKGVLQFGRALRALPDELQGLLKAMLAVEPAQRVQTISEVQLGLDSVNNKLQTACWQAPKMKPVQCEVRADKKKLLLLCLLVLLFMIMLNTGLVTLFGNASALAALQQLLGIMRF